jgi:hypothetical protein
MSDTGDLWQTEIKVRWEWISVEGSPGVPYAFPEPISRHFRTNCNGPAIYRWRVLSESTSDPEKLYIGETELLPRRVCGYLNPGPSQLTNRRLKALFEQGAREGRKVVLERLAFEPFEVDGLTISQSSLSNKAVRRFLEGLFALRCSQSDCEMLNG